MAQLDLEDMYDLTSPRAIAVSPDGQRVAFVTEEFDPDEDETRSSLWTVPADGSREPHRLTRASDAGTPVWSPDGRYLGFIAARETDVERKVGRDADDSEESADDGEDDAGDGEGDANDGEDDAGDGEGDANDGEDDAGDGEDDGSEGNAGNDEPKPQVWVFDMERGGDAIQLTDQSEGVREFDWGPDSERLVVSARDPTDSQEEMLEQRRDDGPIEITRLQHKAEGQGWLDDVRTYLFVVHLETGDTERLDDAYGQGAREPLFGLQPAWAPGERIAFASNRTERPDDSGVMDLYTIDPDGKSLRKLTDSTTQTMAYEWSPEGDQIAFVENHPNNWYKPAELIVAETDGTDDPKRRSVTDSLDRTVSMFGGPSWLDKESLLVSIGDEGHRRLVRARADADDPVRTFPAQTRDRTVVFPDAAGGTVAAGLTDPSEGIDIFALDTADLDAEDPDSLRQLTQLNDELLADIDMPDCRRVTVENSDGIEIESMVYLPPEFDPETDDPRPVIASIHGGPMAFDSPTFSFPFTYWAGEGYVVYRPNYRGSTSYGREFAERLMGTRGDLETDDVLSTLDGLAERGWADPDRSLVTGFSYGGITTANVVTRSDTFTAAAAEHGIYDFRSSFGTDDNHLWSEWEFGLPWENPETYRDISSITDVDQIETPLLVNAGEHDWRCPPTQAEQLYVSVKKQGVPAKLVIYQNEHHNVGDPDRAIHRLESLTDWFREHDPEIDSESASQTEKENTE